MSDLPPPPAWIRWPIRVLAVLFVLPFRLLWELLRVIGRFLERYVGRPLAFLWRHVVLAAHRSARVADPRRRRTVGARFDRAAGGGHGPRRAGLLRPAPVIVIRQ